MNLTSPIQKILYWICFIFFIITSTYLLSVAYSKPFVGIEVKFSNNQWVTDNVYYHEWANQVGLAKGMAIKQVDGVLVENIKSVKQRHTILVAKEIVYQNNRGEDVPLSVHITDIPIQYYTIFFIPAFYFILTIAVAIYLYYDKRHIPSVHYLIFFQMTCSLAYVSISAATRNNILGSLMIGVSMLTALILLLQFLQRYFTFLHIKWPFIKQLKLLYVFPLSIASMTLLETLFVIPFSISLLILLLFLLLFFIIIFVLLFGYFKTRIAHLKILLYGLVGPFLPFVCLFLIPEIAGIQPILSSEISAIFLLFIPLNFLFVQMTERLFDLQYHISRIRYYGNLAFVTSFIMTAIEWFLWHKHLEWITALSVFTMTFLMILCLLFVKERIDFKHRKILFTTHGDSIHRVYSSIQRIGRATNQEQLLDFFIQEVKEKLTLQNIQLTIHDSTRDSFNEMSLKIGEVTKHQQHYYLLLHRTPTSHIILTIHAAKQTLHLKPEEIVWLELMAIYTDIFLGNLTHIEKLLHEMKKLQSVDGETIPWLDKIVWQIVEKEKSVLAQELHDTLLQEQLHLARQLDWFITSPNQATLSLAEIRDQLLDASYTLREYCENLHPPHFNCADLDQALNKLINKVKIRADFTLLARLEPLSIKDPMLLLMIYRLVQELLNNAIKHSQARLVSLELIPIDNGFLLLYEDNGVGFPSDSTAQKSSMGIRGMLERVKAFNGQMTIDSHPANGVTVKIQCLEQCSTTTTNV